MLNLLNSYVAWFQSLEPLLLDLWLVGGVVAFFLSYGVWVWFEEGRRLRCDRDGRIYYEVPNGIQVLACAITSIMWPWVLGFLLPAAAILGAFVFGIQWWRRWIVRARERYEVPQQVAARLRGTRPGT